MSKLSAFADEISQEPTSFTEHCDNFYLSHLLFISTDFSLFQTFGLDINSMLLNILATPHSTSLFNMFIVYVISPVLILKSKYYSVVKFLPNHKLTATKGYFLMLHQKVN